MFTGARSFDGGVQREQIGLFCQIINHFNDAANVIGAMTKHIDNFRGRLNGFIRAIQAISGFFHGLNANHDFFTRTVGDIEKNFGRVRNTLNRSDHLIDRCGSFRHAGSLHLRVLHHVLHVDAHLVHGAGDFFNC